MARIVFIFLISFLGLSQYGWASRGASQSYLCVSPPEVKFDSRFEPYRQLREFLDHFQKDRARIRPNWLPNARLIDAIVEGKVQVDPDWPAPKDYDETVTLMNRLPQRQQVIAALTAAEMVLVIFESGFPIDGVDFRPRQAINLTRRWIEGEDISGSDLIAAAAAARAAGWDAGWAVGAGWAAEAAGRAAGRAAGCTDAAAAARAAGRAAGWAAADADYVAWAAGWADAEERFYRVWWALVRFRLAIKDATTAELNPSNPE